MAEITAAVVAIKSDNVWMRRDPESEDIKINEPVQFGNSRINGNAFLNIVTVVGSARTGKSTLMNRLVGSDVFTTSHSRLACTKGVSVSEVKEAGNNGVVAFVDTEGKGNNNVNNDNKLLTPAVLLSKVIILNVWKQVLVERHLDELELFVHIGERVSLPDSSRLKFGHLIIAVRDYDFEDGTDEEVYNDYFRKEESTNNDAIKRNEIREKLLKMFESIQVKLFRHPLNTTQSNPKMEELKKEIRDKVREPRMFGETTCLTPENVNEITRDIVEQLNTKEELIVLSIVSLIQRHEVNQAYDRCMVSLSKIFEIPDNPRRIGIEGILTMKKNKCIQQFENNTNKADFELQYRKEKKGNLEAYFNARLADKIKVITGLQCKEIDTAARDFQRNLVERLNSIILPQKDERRVEESMNAEATRLLGSFNQGTNTFDLATVHQTSTYSRLDQSYRANIQSRMQKNRVQKQRVKEAKITFKRQLQEKFQSIHLESRNTLSPKLKNITRNVFDKFEQDTWEVNGSSEYKRQTKEKLKLFSGNLEREKLSENDKRQRERTLVDKEKTKFEKSLKSSFHEFKLPVSQAGLLQEQLKRKEREYLQIFDRETQNVDLEAEHKHLVKAQLKDFAMEVINNMVMRNYQKIQDEAISTEGLLISGAVGLGVGGCATAAIMGSFAAETITIIAASYGGGISGIVFGVAIYGIYKKQLVHRKQY